MQVELAKVGGGIELFFDGNRMDMTDDQIFMNTQMFLDSSLAVAVSAYDRFVSFSHMRSEIMLSANAFNTLLCVFQESWLL